MEKTNNNESANINNLYKLDGRVPVLKAIPFGIQHVLAMFVANITPLIILSGLAIYNGKPFTDMETAQLIQNCRLVAGIGTLIQLYPIWKIGARLPIVMGVSFTFLAACEASATQDYGLMIGGVIVGGIFEGLLGLSAKYWKKAIQPVVSGCVVIAIGISLFDVGVKSFASSGTYNVGAWQNLVVASLTLVSCLLFRILSKGFLKQLSILFGLIVGYIIAIPFGMVDFAPIKNMISQMGFIAMPRLFMYKPKFDIGVIVTFAIAFMVQIIPCLQSYGDALEVMEPLFMREKIARKIENLSQKYNV